MLGHADSTRWVLIGAATLPAIAFLAFLATRADADDASKEPIPPKLVAQPTASRYASQADEEAAIRAGKEAQAKTLAAIREDFARAGRGLDGLIRITAQAGFISPSADLAAVLARTSSAALVTILGHRVTQTSILARVRVDERLRGDAGQQDMWILQPAELVLVGDEPGVMTLRGWPLLEAGRQYVVFLTDPVTLDGGPTEGASSTDGYGSQYEVVNGKLIAPHEALDSGAELDGKSVSEATASVQARLSR
ncbi:MAG: hypothetical protein ACKVVT_04490 [Dehalococcoidia bacterium]